MKRPTSQQQRDFLIQAYFGGGTLKLFISHATSDESLQDRVPSFVRGSI